MKNIGLFAGVFDPIHRGHVEFLKRSIHESELDKVYVVIERKPKYKTCLASYHHRKHMVELAISEIPEAEIYESPEDFFPITSSLPELERSFPGSRFFLLIGDDVAKHIEDWPLAKELLKKTKLLIAERGDEDNPYSKLSSLKIREELKDKKTSDGLPSKVLGYCRENMLYQLTGE